MNETIARLLRSQPIEKHLSEPALIGLLDAIRETAEELGDLARDEGAQAVWDRIGDLPALDEEFHVWADRVLDVTPAEAVPQADGHPGAGDAAAAEEETARARAIREAEEDAELLAGVEGEGEVEELPEEEETARARAIREAGEPTQGPTMMRGASGLPEGTDVPFPRGPADASAEPSSDAASGEPSGGASPVELALAALERRVGLWSDRLRQLDEITGVSLGDIRDRLRGLREDVAAFDAFADSIAVPMVDGQPVLSVRPSPEGTVAVEPVDQEGDQEGEEPEEAATEADPPETTP